MFEMVENVCGKRMILGLINVDMFLIVITMKNLKRRSCVLILYLVPMNQNRVIRLG